MARVNHRIFWNFAAKTAYSTLNPRSQIDDNFLNFTFTWTFVHRTLVPKCVSQTWFVFLIWSITKEEEIKNFCPQIIRTFSARTILPLKYSLNFLIGLTPPTALSQRGRAYGGKRHPKKSYEQQFLAVHFSTAGSTGFMNYWWRFRRVCRAINVPAAVVVKEIHCNRTIESRNKIKMTQKKG